MCFGSGDKKRKGSAETQAEQHSRMLDKQLRDAKKNEDKVVRLLLLGAGESGKSTVLKQMKLIHADGFLHQDRVNWRIVIFSNIVQAFQIILHAMEEKNQLFANPANDQYVALIKQEVDISSDAAFRPQYLPAFLSLWSDAGVQVAVARGNEYALHDNLDYFFRDIKRLFHKDYLPTDQDILRARLRTTGITETTFDLGGLVYKMYDVGGQRSERPKWIHVFDNVQVILFLVAISGYDQCLVEDKNANQMIEAMSIFDNIANASFFKKTAVILFMNKIDLFRDKVEANVSPIRKYFPDFTGPERDVKAGQDFFAKKFTSLVKDRPSGTETYVHYTNATDTDLLKKTMASVQDMIVQRNLHQLVL